MKSRAVVIFSEASNRRKGGVRPKRIETDDTAIGIEDVRTRDSRIAVGCSTHIVAETPTRLAYDLKSTSLILAR